ncbi:hypothetical protein [Planctomicrobium sp. SH664]|uniref:hypothetical protein n=1 Tax=Planctomicrobium sp. SH664 TaxID=3448125 RepID=UPI003F5B599A
MSLLPFAQKLFQSAEEPIGESGKELPSQTVVCAEQPLSRELEELLQQHVPQFQQSERKVAILPCGPAGRLQWERLPWPLARLCASPTQDALVLVQAKVWESLPASQSLWQYVLRLPDAEIQILSAAPQELSQPRRPELAPRPRRLPDWLRSSMESFSPKVSSAVEETALWAGIYQVHDQLDRSHSFSQSIEGEGLHHAGDYWHAIMHRREPDYSNSKYWFRHVGQHPQFAELAELASDVLMKSSAAEVRDWQSRLCRRTWQPTEFVDLCQQAARQAGSPLAAAAREIQWQEMLLLLKSTWDDATG